MSDNPPTDDVSAFFRNLREQVGVDFEDEDTDSSGLDRAHGMAQESPPEPAVPESEEAEESDTYPGSRQALKRIDDESAEDDDSGDVDWDSSPRVYTIGGKSTELFTIGALAKALRREVVTLRKWEQKGYLPPAQYRSPGNPNPEPGQRPKHDRLYTRDQVEGLIRILREEKLLNPRKKMRIDQTDFPAKARRLFEELANR